MQKKSAIVEAIQWFEHGDHPTVEPYKYLISNCSHCSKSGNEHGIIRTIYGDYFIVCPGDWILETEKGNYLAYHPKDFKRLYTKMKGKKYKLIEEKTSDLLQEIVNTGKILEFGERVWVGVNTKHINALKKAITVCKKIEEE